MLANPTLLFILFIVAAIGLYVEWAHPRVMLPGLIGAAALVLFFIGAVALSFNWLGFVLMALAVGLLAAGVRTPAHGGLTVGALISLAIGSFLFFDSGSHSATTGVSPIIILSLVAALGVIALLVLRFAIAAQRRVVTTGKESYVGQIVTVIQALTPNGRVRMMGENWQARLDGRFTQPDIRLVHQSVGATVSASASSAASAASPGLAVGAKGRVVRVEGLTLIVEPAQP